MVTPIEAEGNEYYQGRYKEGMIKGPSHERGGVNMLAVEGDFIYPRKYAKQAKMLRGEITKIEDKMKRLENKLSKVSNPQLAENTYKRSFDKVKDELKYLYEQEEALKQQVVLEKQMKEQQEAEMQQSMQPEMSSQIPTNMGEEDMYAEEMPQQQMPVQEFAMGGGVFDPTYNMFGVRSPLDITRTGVLNNQTAFGLPSIPPVQNQPLKTNPFVEQALGRRPVLTGQNISNNVVAPNNNVSGQKPPPPPPFKLPGFQVGDIGVAASSLIPAIYNLYQSRQPIANYNFGRVKPIDYVPLSPEQALREQRLAASTAANVSTRMPAGMRSGMLANLQAGALKGMQDTRFAYDQQNVQNLNQIRQANAQIQQQNIGLAMQERQLRDAALAARQQFGATGMSQLGATLGGVGNAMNQRQQGLDLMNIMQNMGAYFDITVGPDGKPQFSYRKSTPATT